MDFLKKIEAIMNSVKFRNQKLQNALDKVRDNNFNISC